MRLHLKTALHYNHGEPDAESYQSSEVLRAFRRTMPRHDGPQVVYEHGKTWVCCGPCGAQWRVTRDYLGTLVFEEVSHGDDTCLRGR